ncbi:hypothetical protein TGVEG_442490, partial [Toxoplasma gondii VEG]
VPPQVTARGPTSLWHELSTCWVWRRHMVRPLYAMRFAECMRGWSVYEMLGRFVQARELSGGCNSLGLSPILLGVLFRSFK